TARCSSTRPASHSGSPAVPAETSRNGLGSPAMSSADTWVWESCMRGPPPGTWRSSERLMSDAPGRTPPQSHGPRDNLLLTSVADSRQSPDVLSGDGWWTDTETDSSRLTI